MSAKMRESAYDLMVYRGPYSDDDVDGIVERMKSGTRCTACRTDAGLWTRRIVEERFEVEKSDGEVRVSGTFVVESAACHG